MAYDQAYLEKAKKTPEFKKNLADIKALLTKHRRGMRAAKIAKKAKK